MARHAGRRAFAALEQPQLLAKDIRAFSSLCDKRTGGPRGSYAEKRRVLIAWCEVRQGFRQFRSDRIRFAEILDKPIGEQRTHLRRWRESRRVSDLTNRAAG